MEDLNKTVSWFPGHMAKTRRLIQENLKLCDIVCELCDARIPRSSRNPVLAELTGEKPRVIVLNKADLADVKETERWLAALCQEGAFPVAVDCKNKKGAQDFIRAVEKAGESVFAKKESRGVKSRKLRVMVAGIPNVGKSSFINLLAGRKAAVAQDRPGVTRGKQWVGVSGAADLDLLDTPGILWPKIETETQALRLCFTGAVKDEILDLEWVACALCEALKERAPQALSARYRVKNFEDLPGYELLEEIGRKRGFVRRGGVVDTERTAHILLDEYRAGLLGAVTLEPVE